MPAVAPIETSEDTAAFAAAREICRRQGGSFYFASRFLPAAKRSAAYAVGAFCCMIQEAIASEENALEGGAGMRHHPAIVGQSACCSPGGIEGRLQLFRDRLDQIYSGSLELPSPAGRSEAQHALHAFALTVRRYEVPKQYFLDLAEGCRLNLAVARFATWRSLENYCYHTAGVVGPMLASVLGVTHSEAGARAVRLGNAMRLTTLLRDVREDWTHGKIYLPLEDMARFRYTERDLGGSIVNDRFRELMRFQIDRARQLYREGAEGICWLAHDGSRLAASLLAVLHAGILDAIERQGYDVFTRHAQLSSTQTLRRLPGAWRLARHRDGEPVPSVFQRT